MFEKLKMNDKEFEVVKNFYRCIWKGRIIYVIFVYFIELFLVLDGEDEYYKRL